MLTTFSLKSTPIVASVLPGNLPSQKRKVRHVLPTDESPTTMILKTRFCCDAEPCDVGDEAGPCETGLDGVEDPSIIFLDI